MVDFSITAMAIVKFGLIGLLAVGIGLLAISGFVYLLTNDDPEAK